MSTTTNSISSPSTQSQMMAPATQKDALASESTFLTLLVSQLQNQDPLNPTDSTQFVSQLTSYSQLEQLININKNTTPAPAAAPASATTPFGTITPTTGH